MEQRKSGYFGRDITQEASYAIRGIRLHPVHCSHRGLRSNHVAGVIACLFPLPEMFSVICLQ